MSIALRRPILHRSAQQMASGSDHQLARALADGQPGDVSGRPAQHRGVERPGEATMRQHLGRGQRGILKHMARCALYYNEDNVIVKTYRSLVGLVLILNSSECSNVNVLKTWLEILWVSNIIHPWSKAKLIIKLNPLDIFYLCNTKYNIINCMEHENDFSQQSCKNEGNVWR